MFVFYFSPKSVFELIFYSFMRKCFVSLSIPKNYVWSNLFVNINDIINTNFCKVVSTICFKYQIIIQLHCLIIECQFLFKKFLK